MNIPKRESSSSDLMESSYPDFGEPTPKADFKINLHDAKIFIKSPSLPSGKSPVKSDLWRKSTVKKREIPEEVEPGRVKRTFEDIPDIVRPR